MTNRDRLWRRACNWCNGWTGGASTPTPEMAYIAGWQAAVREMRKGHLLLRTHQRKQDTSSEERS